MQLNTYLVFNGQCEAAFKFYEQILGGKILAMFTHAGTPAAEHVPPEWLNKIMHVTLEVGDGVLMGSDAPPDHFKAPQGFSVNIAVEQVADAERIFHALSENGTVGMPIQKTFWAERWGMVTDQYGIPWMVNCEGKVKYE
jgi:PhnB protein